MPDRTKLPPLEKTIEGCQVINVPAGATPKNITIELPGPDGARVLARWTGFPSGLVATDYVTVRRSAGYANQYTVTGTSRGTAVGDPILKSIIDAKGDLIAGTAADTAARLAVGSNGKVLTADSAEATGLKWVTPSTGGWPFAHVLTVSSTDPDAQYTNLPDAVTASSAGDAILLDAETYTLAASLALGTAVTIVGQGPGITIITNATSNTSTFDVTVDNVIFRNLTIRQTAAGSASGCISTDNAGLILDNVALEKTSGAPTVGYALWMYGGSVTLKNGTTLTCSSGTSQYGIYHTSATATITAYGSKISGGTLDILGDQTGSTLSTFGTILVHNSIDFAGNYPRASIEPTPTPPILLNGIPTVWQRGTSFAAIANAAYFADKWRYSKVGAMVHTVTQDADVPTVAQIGCKLNYSIKVDCTTVDSSIAAGDYCYLRYAIEGFDFLQIAQQQFTIPIWVKATKTGVYCAAFKNSGNDRAYVFEYTVNAADTWEYKLLTVAASPTAGTWNYTNGVGLAITFALACGSTFHTTAGAWQTGDYLATSNQVNACDNTANNFFIIVGDPIPGIYARPLQIVPYQQVLDHCMRYAFALDATSDATDLGFGRKSSTTVITLSDRYPVPMRAVPSLSHNISGYTAGAPTTTTITLLNFTAGGFFAITGALTVTLTAASLTTGRYNFTAGTSWDGTTGNIAAFRIGPGVVAIVSADL
jgi:hypothetical protein